MTKLPNQAPILSGQVINLTGRSLDCIICEKPVSQRWQNDNLLLKCPGCGLIFSELISQPDEAGKNYRADYFSGVDYADYRSEKKALQETFQRYLKILARYSSGGRLYEIGCAYGYFLDLARRKWEVSGIDVCAESTKFARESLQLNVTGDNFLKAPVKKDYYNVFCLWDTIEHLAQPHQYLEKISRLITKDGLLCISTGDIDSPMARLRGKSWRLINPAIHLFYFNKNTIKRLLTKYKFQLLLFTYPTYSRTIRQMAYRMVQKQINKSSEMFSGCNFLSKISGTGLGDYIIRLNLFDIMVVIARKI
ncbi:MAG: class I SAM-dependent methyltransferase [Planctomycetota bacterium]